MHLRPLVLPLACLLLSGVVLGEELKYSAAFADGHRMTGAILSGWQRPGQVTRGEQKLNDRPIFDKSNPVRWIKRENAPAVVAPKAFVEFVGGNRLPGRVQGIGATVDKTKGQIPPHLIVEADNAGELPEHDARGQVRILTRWLRRIAWERRSNQEYQPATLFYRDGRQLTFQAVRFGDGAVNVLTAEERRQVPFDDMAELHLPRQSFWDAYFEQLALLASADGERLLRITTSDGAVLTTTAATVVPASRRRSGDYEDRLFHAVQPPWALDPVFVRVSRIVSWLSYAPHEVPLSLVELSQVTQRATLAVGWRPALDANTQGGPLESQGQSFGCGYGVQSYSELHFELPECTRSFQSRFGLDDSVADGGCVRGIVQLGRENRRRLYESKTLVGSNEVVDTGSLSLDGLEANQRNLVLVVDPAHEDRPTGADPFDIRDMAAWLEPQIDLDSEMLKAELDRRRPQIEQLSRLRLNRSKRN